MSEMNSRTRKKSYSNLVKRYGEFCRCCGKLPHEGQLVVDHKDNNPYNDDPSNHQLLCRACNYLKNPRREPVDLCVSESVIDGRITEIDINRRKESLFRKEVYHMINEFREVPQNEIINGISEAIGISPATAKRYLDKMCSGRGTLERINRVRTILIRYKTSPLGL